MEFIFQTVYDQKALTAMAKALRKTVRKKHSRRSHLFGWLVILFAVLLILPLEGEPFTLTFTTVLNILAALLVLVALIWEDSLNGYFARKRMLPGSSQAVITFGEENYTSVSQVGTTIWPYDNIKLVAETPDYFIFLFNKNHAQAYDKKTLAGGTLEDFRTFIQKKTNTQIATIQ